MIKIHCYQRDKDTKGTSKKLLQTNLSHYLKVEGKDLNIQTNENGKPSVAGLYFSVSHCRNFIVQAFWQDGDLGIDIEFKNPKRKYMMLAQRYFHRQEFTHLSSLNNEQALSLFYNLWTTKEAYCKAQGGRLWYYLAKNFLDEHNNIQSEQKGLYIMQLNQFSDYSITLVTQTKVNQKEFINE